VHDDVDTPEGLNRLAEEALDVQLVRDVSADRDRATVRREDISTAASAAC